MADADWNFATFGRMFLLSCIVVVLLNMLIIFGQLALGRDTFNPGMAIDCCNCVEGWPKEFIGEDGVAVVGDAPAVDLSYLCLRPEGKRKTKRSPRIRKKSHYLCRNGLDLKDFSVVATSLMDDPCYGEPCRMIYLTPNHNRTTCFCSMDYCKFRLTLQIAKWPRIDPGKSSIRLQCHMVLHALITWFFRCALSLLMFLVIMQILFILMVGHLLEYELRGTLVMINLLREIGVELEEIGDVGNLLVRMVSDYVMRLFRITSACP